MPSDQSQPAPIICVVGGSPPRLCLLLLQGATCPPLCSCFDPPSQLAQAKNCAYLSTSLESSDGTGWTGGVYISLPRPLSSGVGNATASVLNEVIYVTGGHYGYRGSCTYDKIQSYHSDINEWNIITTSPHPEYGLCSIALENKLYLVGGQTTIIDCYDPQQDEWKQKADMMERRMECGAVVMNGCIYVTGGYSSSKGSYLQNIEKYDPECNTWEIVSNLPSAMRSHGCVSVYSV